jgi:hypothetical protein
MVEASPEFRSRARPSVPVIAGLSWVVGTLVLAVTIADALAVLAELYVATLVVSGLAGLPYRQIVFWYIPPSYSSSRLRGHSLSSNLVV